MLSRLALVAALLVVPAVAFTDANTASRAASASVKDDADSYLKAVKTNPSLTIANAYTAPFLTLTNDYATGTTLDVAVTKTAGNARFAIAPPAASLGVGGSQTFTVTDTSALHTPTSDTLTVRVDATIRVGTTNVGFLSYSRSVTVTV